MKNKLLSMNRGERIGAILLLLILIIVGGINIYLKKSNIEIDNGTVQSAIEIAKFKKETQIATAIDSDSVPINKNNKSKAKNNEASRVLLNDNLPLIEE